MFGGLIRALIGFIKSRKHKEKFKLNKFSISLFIAGLIGAFCALLTVEDYRIVLLAGYAGTDLIHGIYKLRK